MDSGLRRVISSDDESARSVTRDHLARANVIRQRVPLEFAAGRLLDACDDIRPKLMFTGTFTQVLEFSAVQIKS